MKSRKLQQKSLQQQASHHKLRFKNYTPSTPIEHLSYLLIRPPKALYDPSTLYPRSLRQHHTHQLHHIPFELSLYLPKHCPLKYVILYLHCNSSNKLEGTQLVEILPSGVGLACFDFEACGMREGEWVTLGATEAKEVDTAARWLKERGYRVVGWGRSMGAVSLLMSQQCQIMVADSPFYNLEVLCKEFGRHAPKILRCFYDCFFPCAICCVKRDIRKKTSQDIFQVLDIEKKITNMSNKKSILFVSAKNDTFVDKSHSEKLYASFSGYKRLVICEGDHNSEREQKINRQIFRFISAAIQMQQIRLLQDITYDQKPMALQKTVQALMETQPY